MNAHTSEQAKAPVPRVVEIELLALDLTTCTRCVGTLENIEKAINIVRPVLEATGAQVKVTSRVIESDEQARQYRFVASPTIRINGKDIVFETLQSQCDSCTDLCGCAEGTSCRIWPYRGKEYTEAPVGLVIEALLEEVRNRDGAAGETRVYAEVPENLRRFFRSQAAMRRQERESCCSSVEQETCCAPDEKGRCCDPKEHATCGCR